MAQAHVIPDQVMFRAAWSLTPMIAASILVYRENRVAGVKELFRRIVDYRRIKSKIWYLPVFLAGPFIVFVQYGLARWSGLQVPPPHLTLLVPLSFVGFFLIAYAEELGWTVYALDTLQEKRSALTAGVLAGIMWASLHAPVWALAGQSLAWCAWQWIYVVALRVLMAWIYNNTGKSLFAMDLLHPGLFVWWYLWPVTGQGLSMPTVYDPRNLALITIGLAAIVSYLWGPTTLVQYRYAVRAITVA
ncbi:MAG TPA: CPBP family intramembrane glutamic endopeptidase [Gemmatimonadales bacterium]|nr:CPBP family intramembrane glutamic endopeptidase [Gemmatimonadales bacterium]